MEFSPTDADAGLLSLYPEARVGGFTSVDGTIEFYSRVNALLTPDMIVLDLGAGRGVWYSDDRVSYRRSLRNLRGKVTRVIGVDVDPAVVDNPSVDDARVMSEGGPIPVDSATVDMIICDAVFEHVEDPDTFISEIDRILKPGGWLCARTPNRAGYPALMARLVPNSRHARVLRRMQPRRKDADVFPTRFLLNDRKQLEERFSEPAWSGVVYTPNSEPSYAGRSVLAWRAFYLWHRVLPRRWCTGLVLFVRRAP
jgi:SAM-dependent methyltransferase